MRLQNSFKDFYSMVENQFQTKRSILQIENGIEFYNDCLGDFLLEKDILYRLTCRDITQENGIAERKNRHLLEVDKALMFHMNVPTYLLGDAILTSGFIASILHLSSSRVLFNPKKNLKILSFSSTFFIFEANLIIKKTKLLPKMIQSIEISSYSKVSLL